MQYQWDFAAVWSHFDMLIVGLIGTVELALVSIVLGVSVGFFVDRSFELTKTTALASSLAYAELLYQAMQVNSITYRPMEVYTTIALMYFIMLFAASNLMRLVEYRLSRVG